MKNLISVKNFWNYKYDYNITKKQLENLIKQGYINTSFLNGNQYVGINEISLINDIHNDLKRNYTRFSTFFLKLLGKSVSYSDNKFYNKVIKNLGFDKSMKLYNYLGVNYIHNKHIEILKNELVTLQYLIQEHSITPIVYEHLIEDFTLSEIVFGQSLRLLPQFQWKLVKDKISKYEFLNNFHFESTYNILKSRKYSDFFLNKDTLLNFCDYHRIYLFKNYRGIIYINMNQLNIVIENQNKLQKQGHDFMNILKMFLGRNSHQDCVKKEILSNFISVFETYEYDYYQCLTKDGDLVYYFSKLGADYFLEEFISFNRLKKKYTLTTRQLNYLINLFDIENYYLASNLTIVRNNSLGELFESDIANIYLKRTNKFYTRSEFAKHLGLDVSRFNIVIEEEKLHTYKLGMTSYFYKHDLINLRGKKENTLKEYAVIKQNKNPQQFKQLQSKRRASGIERFSFGERGVYYIACRKEIDEYKRSQEIKNQFKIQLDSINYNNPWQAFQQLLTLYSYNQSSIKNNISLDYWFKYSYKRLQETRTNDKGIKYYVECFINCTKTLSDFIGRDELKNKTTKEINFTLLNSNKKYTERYEFYIFLRTYFYNNSDETFKFTFKSLDNPFLKNEPTFKHPKEVYTFKEFNYIYSYTNNLNHLESALLDCEYALNSRPNYKFKNLCYSWLYVLIHLNNAWRHTDICELKMINLDFLKIQSFSEFNERKLSNLEINKIVGLLLSEDYPISKTNVTTKFYVTDNIKVALAYSYTLCYLFNKEMYPYTKKIINFNNKYNSYTKQNNNSFFFNSKIEINFKNRKMNRTLLSLMYKLVKSNNPEAQSIDIAKRLRSHRDVESTHTYIDVPEQELNSLTEKLFDKGIFGYIPETMKKLLDGVLLNENHYEISLNKITKIFKSIYHVEVSSGFLNHLISQKQIIIDTFIMEDPKNIFDKLNNLKLNLLPGKDENFQCLAEGTQCIYPGKDCADCILSVPNFYAISNIAKKISNNINFINDNYNELQHTEKVKYANLTLNLLETLHYAIKRFGKENVLQFFKNGENGYIKLLESLDNVSDNNNLLDYASYNLEDQ